MMPEERPSELAAEFDWNVDDLPESVDRAAIERMRLVAKLLDDSIRVPGTDYRIGIDPLIGVVPVAGDLVSGGISLYIVVEAARLGVSYPTLLRMIANVSVDVAGGSVPYVGDVFDAVWKANMRNLKLVLADLAVDDAGELRDRGERIEIEDG